jgi:opacity protein-like surface antigen
MAASEGHGASGYRWGAVAGVRHEAVRDAGCGSDSGFGARGGGAGGLLAGPSPAQELGGRWYVKLFGGATFPQDDNFVLQEESPCIFMPCLWRGSGLSYDTGFTLGAAAGLKLTPNVAVELEYTYRGADMDLKKLVGVDGTTDTNAFMVNGLYRFTPWSDSAWRP